MRRIHIIIALVAAVILVSFTVITRCIGSSEDLVPTSVNSLLDNSMSTFDATEGFDRSIEKFMQRWELKGASFALMRNDSLIYAKGYGAANDSMACNVNNLFRIASASKLITAVAIMKLVEGDRLSLDDQVFGEQGILNDSIFLNLYSRRMERIRVKHLLQHTAGFSSSYGDPAFANFTVARVLDKPLPITEDDIIEFTTINKMRAEPGERYDYSNVGYIILGKIVEKVTSMSYQAYVRDSILWPIGCYDMHIGRNFSRDRHPAEVQYYEVKEATPVEAYDGSGVMTSKSDGGNNVTALGGAGGWIASATELLLFVASINDCPVKPDILSSATIKMMVGDERNRPMGWAEVRGNEWLRSGSMAGTSALIKRQKDGYTWVFISNSSAWISHKLSNYISSHISRAISQVEQWPERDLFAVGGEY